MKRSQHAYLVVSLLSLVGAACSANAVDGHTPQGRIVGGSTVAITYAPHLVSLRHKHNASAPFLHRCSGTIYSTTVVLTTANCVIGLELHHIQIVAGTSYRSQMEGYVHLVDKRVIHPDFNIWFTNNDLALVHLAIELTSSRPKLIAPIALGAAAPAAGSVAVVAGWGATVEGGEYAEQLQQALVSVLADEQCKQSYGETRITSAMLCAGAATGENYVDACRGDAGSALVVHEKAVGLVSWGSGCGRKDFPGVYTNLTVFGEWIADEVAKLEAAYMNQIMFQIIIL